MKGNPPGWFFVVETGSGNAFRHFFRTKRAALDRWQATLATLQPGELIHAVQKGRRNP